MTFQVTWGGHILSPGQSTFKELDSIIRWQTIKIIERWQFRSDREKVLNISEENLECLETLKSTFGTSSILLVSLR